MDIEDVLRRDRGRPIARGCADLVPSERETIASTPAPVTRASLVADLRALGLAADEGDFDQIGAAIAAAGLERSGPVGAGVGRLCSQRVVVDFAVGWIAVHRTEPDAD